MNQNDRLAEILEQASLRTSGKISRLKSGRMRLVQRIALLVIVEWPMVLLVAWTMAYA
jgi:hypothetical protein